MCAGAPWWRRGSAGWCSAPPIPRPAPRGTLYNLCADPRLNHEVEVTAGVRAGEAGDQLRAFFAARRDRYP